MEIIRYSPDKRGAWNELVFASRNGTFLHSRDYMDYHADRFVDHSLLICEGDKIIAIFVANEIGETIVSHGGLTYGGLLYPTTVHAPDVLEIFEKIGFYYKSVGKSTIQYKAVPHVFHRYPAEDDLYALFRLNCRLFRRDASSVIKLADRPKFSDSRKNTARKSEKIGVQVILLEDCSDFHRLLSDALAKFGTVPVHSLEELRLLKTRFPEQIKLHGAWHDGQLIAATLVYDFGQSVHTQYMASSDLGRKHGALDFLLIWLIEKTYSEKIFFSFGISTELQGKVLNEGLILQKEGFGGRTVVHDFYEWIL